MEFQFFSRNGELLPIDLANIRLSNIEYQYGFGVYETLRVREGAPYFLAQHIERLLESARIIGVEHSFSFEFTASALSALVESVEKGTYNLKILLLGGAQAQLDIMPLNPHFPDKKLYRDGVHCATYHYERSFPHAKSLNMLESYLALQKAREVGAYDALFTDRAGNITEGTRTNFFCMKGTTLVSPPEEKILLGITREVVLKIAAELGFSVEQKEIPLSSLAQYDGAFLTSTSSGVMPVASVDDFRFAPQPEAFAKLIAAFDAFMEHCSGKL